MAPTSTSTFAEVAAQYDDNADYDLNGSVSQAKLFIHAARILIRRRPTYAAGEGGQSVVDE